MLLANAGATVVFDIKKRDRSLVGIHPEFLAKIGVDFFEFGSQAVVV
jgi:hypothetical protein